MQEIEHNSQNVYCTLQNAYVIRILGFGIVPLQKWKESRTPPPPKSFMCHIKWANLRAREADKERHLKFHCPLKN